MRSAHFTCEIGTFTSFSGSFSDSLALLSSFPRFQPQQRPTEEKTQLSAVYTYSSAASGIYLGVDCLAHGNTGTLQCILLHTEVTPLAEKDGKHMVIY